ncbi:hypothetical protein ACJJTC_019289 [Scirpophaga incertulas]
MAMSCWQVTAPYNSNLAANEPDQGQGLREENAQEQRQQQQQQQQQRRWEHVANDNHNNENIADDESGDELDDVQLPCEFCNRLQPADDLVRHQEAGDQCEVSTRVSALQTGCRPDLVRVQGGGGGVQGGGGGGERAGRGRGRGAARDPVRVLRRGAAAAPAGPAPAALPPLPRPAQELGRLR